MITTRTL